MESKLFTTGQLGPITLRNRAIRSAAFENMAYGNKPSQDLYDYHTAVARGGIGMTTVAYCSVTRSGVSFDGQLYIHDEIKDDLKKLTDGIHAEGAKASIQLGHCGNMTHCYTCHCLPVGASTGFNLYSPTLHRALKKEEIHDIVKAFGHAVDFAVNVDSTAWRYTQDTDTSSRSSSPPIPTVATMSTEAAWRTVCVS